ncbi:ATP-dependent Clp protease proteolytic subunit [Candidatus Nasuia deltocephalinicola]|nr:ATP-dependent Clp protease proteolytic subunit [Candidatus Nasuia deltocephalinicola]
MKNFNKEIYNFIPTVIDKTNKGDYNYDLYSKLLKERIIFIFGEISNDITNLIIAQLLYLEGESNEKDIYIYINSIGGSVSNGLAIFDTINYIKSDVCTFCLGVAYSMGAFLLSSGKKGKRFSLSNSRIMIHQPLSGIQGQVTDMKIHVDEVLKLKRKLIYLFSLNTNKSIKKIIKDTERDFFMSPLKALKYGIIDSILLNK